MDALFTRKEYLQLPEGWPVQLIEGCLVKEGTPVYGHQRWALRTSEELVKVVPKGQVLLGPLDVAINDWNSYHPDVAIFREVPPDTENGTLLPLVVFEVLSPSTERYDRNIKRKNYLKAGVAEVWLMDRENQAFEVHSRAGVRTAQGSESVASVAIPGFSLSPATLAAPPPETPAPPA